MLNVDLTHVSLDVAAMEGRLEAAHKALEELNAAGTSKTGWMDFPNTLEDTDVDDIAASAWKIRAESQAVAVIGVGGSYLGARAVMELVQSQYYNETGLGPKIYFVGNSLSTREIDAVTRKLEGKDFSIIVISKSGTTLEPALALRHFYGLLTDRYGAAADSRVYAVTDKESGKLRAMAGEKGWKSFIIPGSIGGRYSVFTAVGLLPLAVAGLDIKALVAGAAQASRELAVHSMDNPVWQYAAARNALYDSGKKIELLTCFEPSFRYTSEWWKQLYGESEGKDHKGIFPASAIYTMDLHSLGQYVQQGERSLFETLVRFGYHGEALNVSSSLDGDGLGYLNGRDMDGIQTITENAVVAAHTAGGVPCVIINTDDNSEHSVGYLLYFFMLACGVSAMTLGVDPFNQPGVEDYKSNMFTMLKG